MKPFILLFLLIWIPSLYSYAQSGGGLPSIPPSPEAAAFAKYGQYPVDKNTGVVKIDIPLYTIKSGELELPISISYHASGIKVDEIASWVGLGWTLNAGGAVSRAIMGGPDQYVNTFIPVNDIDSDDFYYLDNIYSGASSGESDIYTYNVGGLMGSFRYNHEGQIVQIPYSDNKIIPPTMNSNTFTIISNNGIKYYFTSVDNVTSDNSYTNYASAWFVTQIVSANNSDTIYLEYDNEQQSHVRYESEMVDDIGVAQFTRTVTQISYSCPLLSRITFKTGYIDFITETGRYDNSTTRLTEIRIHSNNGAIKKRISFEHDYFVSPNAVVPSTYMYNVDYRLKLTDIVFKTTLYDEIERYSFNYNTTQLPHYYINCGDLRTDRWDYFNQDYWGYYNGPNNNKWFYDESFSNCSLCESPAERDVDEDYAKACMLQEIVYPTGGKTVFDYEGNLDGQSGGLRIASIKSYATITDITPVTTTTYEYIGGTTFQYHLYSDINDSFDQVAIDLSTHTYHPANSPLTCGYSGGLTLYNVVTEYNGTSTVNSGKTVYEYDFYNDGSYQVPYDAQYTNSRIDDPKCSQYLIDNSWRRGQIKWERIYKNNNGNYALVRSKNYEYQTYRENEFIVGTFCFRNYVDISQCYLVWSDTYKFYPSFQYFDLKASTGVKLLTRTTETEYTDNGNIVTTTDYSYDAVNDSTNSHTLLTEKSVIGGDSIATTTNYIYPPDIAGYSDTLILDMVNRNMIAYPIQEEVRKASKVISAKYNKYGYENGLIVLKSFATTEIDEPLNDIARPYIDSYGNLITSSYLKEKIFYDKYDSDGNLLQMHYADDIYISYIWDYDNAYPVARLENIEYSSIGPSLYNNVIALHNYNDLLSSITRTHFKTIINNILTNCPSSVFPTIYTYIPLVGMTSETDSNGITTYYEYDPFGRLSLIRDNGGWVFKTFEYHYKE